MKYLGLSLVMVLACVLGFGISSAILYGICWAFGLNFTWKLALGVWLVSIILRSIFKSNK